MLVQCVGLTKAEAARITPHGARAEDYNRARRKQQKGGTTAVSLSCCATALGAEPHHRQMLREQLLAICAVGFGSLIVGWCVSSCVLFLFVDLCFWCCVFSICLFPCFCGRFVCFSVLFLSVFRFVPTISYWGWG